MKRLNYNGSLADDIISAKKEGFLYENISRKQKKSLIILICADVLWLSIGLLIHNFLPIASLFTSSAAIFTSYNTSIRNKSLTEEFESNHAKRNISKFASNLLDTQENQNDLTNCISEQNIIDAVVVTNSEKVEDHISPFAMISEATGEDIKSYVEIVTSDIYLLDLNNQIRALKEIKKIIYPEDKKNRYVKEVTLDILEEQDLPKRLPIERVLEPSSTFHKK